MILLYPCNRFSTLQSCMTIFQSSIDAAFQLRAYIQLGPTEESALMSGSDNNKHTYHNIDAQQNPNGEPIYEVIPSKAETSRTVQGAQDISCNENPAYNHLGVHIATKESFQADPASLMMASDYCHS